MATLNESSSSSSADLASGPVNNQCELLEPLSSAWPLQAVLALKLMANCLALVLFLLHKLPMLKARPIMFHSNMRAIYNFFLLSSVGTALTFAMVYAFDLIRLFQTDPCRRVWPLSLLVPIRLASYACIYGQDSALLVLCAERLLCFRRLRHYEQSTRPCTVWTLLMTITLAICLPDGWLYMRGISLADTSNTSSVLSEQNKASYQITLIFMATVELAAFVALVFIHRWARGRRRLLHRLGQLQLRATMSTNDSNSQKRGNSKRVDCSNRLLSIKFQLEETVRASALFLPVALSKCGTFQFALTSLTLLNILPPLASWLNGAGLATQMLVSEAVTVGYYQPLLNALLLLHGHCQLKPLLIILANRLRFWRGCCCNTSGGQLSSSSRSRVAPASSSSDGGAMTNGKNGMVGASGGKNEGQDEHFKRLADLFEKGIG